MKTLQLEIYNTLLERQSIQEFEQFLYNNENILDNLENNIFFYQIMIINYRLDNCLLQLRNEAYMEYGENFMQVLTVERSCIDMLQTNDTAAHYSILRKMIREFDFNWSDKYNISYKFEGYYYHMDEMFEGGVSEVKLNPEIQNLAQEVLTQLAECTSYSAKKAIVFEKPPTIPTKKEINPVATQKIIPPKKSSLRKKIAYFFSSFVKVH